MVLPFYCPSYSFFHVSIWICFYHFTKNQQRTSFNLNLLSSTFEAITYNTHQKAAFKKKKSYLAPFGLYKLFGYKLRSPKLSKACKTNWVYHNPNIVTSLISLFKQNSCPCLINLSTQNQPQLYKQHYWKCVCLLVCMLIL